MTTIAKLVRCDDNSGWISVRNVDGVWWSTDGRILARLDESPETGGYGRSEAYLIKRVLDNAIAALPGAIPAMLGALGKDSRRLLRKILAGGEEHYLMERYVALMRGELYWIGGGFNGPHHWDAGRTLAGVENGVLVTLLKGMRDEVVARDWEPITESHDPAAEAEYYRNLALYPEEEEEEPRV